MEYKALKVIISGGGTGGHIFPALSIADAIKKLNPNNEILFVGAIGKMEMERVPNAGYKIIGLPIVGIQRQFNFKNIVNNISVPIKLIKSLYKAKKIIKDFKPDVVIGVGGYASGPILWAATKLNIPSLIQEQNGFAGLANKLLCKKVDKICVAYSGMERFFPKDKIIITGNPIRQDLCCKPSTEQRQEGIQFYGLDPTKKHIFIVGGSLGSGTLNNAVKQWIINGCVGGENIELIWQCGKYYKQSIDKFMQEHSHIAGTKFIHYYDFIKRMDLAYACCDIIISRSGASTVSELCAQAKATIFVPSPNVAEDHQTHNAMALVNNNAALIIKDTIAQEALMPKAIELISNTQKIKELEENIAKLALPNASLTIAQEAYKIVK